MKRPSSTRGTHSVVAKRDGHSIANLILNQEIAFCKSHELSNSLPQPRLRNYWKRKRNSSSFWNTILLLYFQISLRSKISHTGPLWSCLFCTSHKLRNIIPGKYLFPTNPCCPYRQGLCFASNPNGMQYCTGSFTSHSEPSWFSKFVKKKSRRTSMKN